MRLPVLLFALVAFFIGSVLADPRPIPVGSACPASLSGDTDTDCLCSGGCTQSSQVWFSCYLASDSVAIEDIGIRFEAAYAQPSQTRSWQISNTLNWPTGLAVDNYQPSTTFGTDPNSPGPNPQYSSYTSQWTTAGVGLLGPGNPTGPNMWACTVDGLLARSLNKEGSLTFGPAQPRCYSSETATYTAPYSQGCQEALLYDANGANGLNYRGWGYAGLKAQTWPAGTYPNVDNPGTLTTVPTSPLTSSQLQALPIGGATTGKYNVGGIDMTCYISLFNPCDNSGCPSSTPICINQPANGGPCNTGDCCASGSIIKPNNGVGAWQCCGTGTSIVTYNGNSYCCPNNGSAPYGIDNNGNCCPTSRLVNGQSGTACCAVANYDPSKPGKCCATAVTQPGQQCCTGSGPFYSTSPGISPSQNFDGTTSYCCPTANLNDGTGSNVACCPTGGEHYVSIDVSNSGGSQTKYCCPTAQYTTSTVADTSGEKVCCPSANPISSVTYTEAQGQSSQTYPQCCLNANLAHCSTSQSSDPICCFQGTTANGQSTTCLGTSGSSYFVPCCATSSVTTISGTQYCCPNAVSGNTYVWYSSTSTCCLSSYSINLSGKTGTGYSPPSNPPSSICCPNGNTATTAPSPGLEFACSSVSATDVCTWTTSSACCNSADVVTVGSNEVCCGSSGPFYACSGAAATCPKNNNGSPQPCCPKSGYALSNCNGVADVSGGGSYCCQGSGPFTCTSQGQSTGSNPDICCPSANVPLNGATYTTSNTSADYCCNSAGQIYVSAASPCCNPSHIPVNAGTNTKNYAQCCSNSGMSWTGTQCCYTANTVSDGAGGWLCCATAGSVNYNGQCCAPNQNFNNDQFCCPNSWAGITATSTFCTAAQEPGPNNCWVDNANCAAFGETGDSATQCCCYDNNLAVHATNGPALPANDICCAKNPQSSTTWYYITTGTFPNSFSGCCPATYAVFNYQSSLTSGTQSAFCCAETPNAIGSSVAGVQCSFYLSFQNDASPDGNGQTNDCCRNCDISRNYNSNPVGSTTSTAAGARCCGNAQQTPILVTEVETIAHSQYTTACCPVSHVLAPNGATGNLYCCSNLAAGYSSYVDHACCTNLQTLTDPQTGTQYCCTSYSGSTTPVWANYGGGLSSGSSASCCPSTQVITFTAADLPSGAVTPNVPASNASGAPTNFGVENVYCCPAGQVVGTPAANAYIPAIDATSGATVNFGTSYNQLRCCPVSQVIRVQIPSQGNKVFDVCCPSSGMVWNTNTLQCCQASVITPPCPNPPLTGCSGQCCGSGQTGAIAVTSNDQIQGSGTSCCPNAQIYTPASGAGSYDGDSFCCPTSLMSQTPTAAWNSDGTLAPCCPKAWVLPCNYGSSVCTATTESYDVCCNPANYPITVNNNPQPSLIVNPANGQCCRGYLNVAGPNPSVLPGGTTCCVPNQGVTVYVNSVDNPCCTTIVNSTDNTCCSAAAFHAPSTCCSSSEAWTPEEGICCPLELATDLQANGTYLHCCDQAGYTADPGHTCCNTSIIQNGYCCPPSQLDSFGHCCQNGTLPLPGYIDVSSGTPVVVPGVSACCNSQIDCNGYCYYLDPTDNEVKPFFVQGNNNTGCCNYTELDCGGACPVNGVPVNTGVPGDCCPASQRGCLNGVKNTGACGAADTNCCNQYSGANCTSCITNPGCGWCNNVGSAQGLCESGDYFGPTPGVEGIVCNQTGGQRWTAVGQDATFLQLNGFDDGRYIQFANVSVLLAANQPWNVTFLIKAPESLPLDVYILLDRTVSFVRPPITTSNGTSYPNGPLDVLKSVIGELDQGINNLAPGYHLGFGTFGDKAVQPFGYWDNSGLFDYVYVAVSPIVADHASLITLIENLDPNSFAGGDDIPEASLEAFLHVSQDPAINWGTTRADQYGRQVPVNKIAILVSDAPAHYASTTLAPGTQLPSTPFPVPSPSDPENLGYYLGAATTEGVALQPPQSWHANTGDYLDTYCSPTDPGAIRSPLTAYDVNRTGICADYPSKDQVATAIANRGLTCVFALAPTVSTSYPLSAAYDFWSNFSVNELPASGAANGFAVHLDWNVDPDTPGGLVYTIEQAIQNITQTIRFENISGSPFMPASTSVDFNLPPNGVYSVTVPLLWDGTDYGSDGPFPIYFQAIFPLSNYVIDNATIDVFISPEKRCCFCGDGVVQREAGCDEECDDDGATDSICCRKCQIDVGQVCDNTNLCVPLECNATGLCQPFPVQSTCVQAAPDDPLAFCSFNGCLAGACVVQCNSDACCDDNDNCTEDTCLLSLSLCSYTLLDDCDCSNSAYNDCFACVRNNNTKCAWEANSGTCFEFNQTIYEQGGYGTGINPVSTETGIAKFCVAGTTSNGNTGIIVGSVFGALAAVGMIALAAALAWRLRNGPLAAPGGAANTAGNQGATTDNPTYVSVSTQTNPLAA